MALSTVVRSKKKTRRVVKNTKKNKKKAKTCLDKLLNE